MRDFINAALPWVLIGIALAVALANHHSEEESGDSQNALYMGIGMVFGIAAAAAGILHSYALGVSIGILGGLAVGNARRKGE